MTIIRPHMPICDRCGECDNSMAYEEESELTQEMSRQGWSHTKEGDVCPDCSEEEST